MEANAAKRKEPRKALRVKVISMGNAEVGKVRRCHWLAGVRGRWADQSGAREGGRFALIGALAVRGSQSEPGSTLLLFWGRRGLAMIDM